MHRINGLDHVNNKFSDGNPAQGTEGTEVTNEWLNDVQENIAQAIEAAGIVLVEGEYDQLYKAIVQFAENQSYQNPLLNNVTNQAINGLIVDPLKFKSARIDFTIYRKTTEGGEFAEAQSFMAFWYDDSETWKIQNLFIETPEDNFSGVTIRHIIDAVTGELSFEYDSSNLVGANYSGRISYRLNRLL